MGSGFRRNDGGGGIPAFAGMTGGGVSGPVSGYGACFRGNDGRGIPAFAGMTGGGGRGDGGWPGNHGFRFPLSRE